MKKIDRSISNLLKTYSQVLKEHNIKSYRLDVLIFLESVTGLSRSKILSEQYRLLKKRELKLLNLMIRRRLKKYSVAEIVQHKEFYNRDFFVNKNVLIPRPESETIIDHLLDISINDPVLSKKQQLNILDVGCGSGVLGITAKLELKNANVELIDIDKKALKVAEVNNVLKATKLHIYRSDLFQNVRKDFDIMLVNLPYVPDNLKHDDSIHREPVMAISGGHDGLAVYRVFFNELNKLQKKPLYLILEALDFEHQHLISLASTSGYKKAKLDNLTITFKRKAS